MVFPHMFDHLRDVTQTNCWPSSQVHVMEIYDDINDRWSYWKSLFFLIMDSIAPLVKAKMKVKRSSSEWIDADLHSLMRTRNYYQRKYWQTHTS